MTLALLTLMTALVIWKRRAVVRFMDDLSDGNVERLIREERASLNAWEARIVLARMEKEKVG